MNPLSWAIPPLIALVAVCAGGEPREAGVDSADGRGAYFTGVYPDLFVDLLGKSASEVRARIDTAFSHLFAGDSSSGRVFYPVGEDMGYIEDIANNDVRTEGMSYGMMIAVQLDRPEIFNRLWKWAKTHMQLAGGAHAGYFAWHCRTDGPVIDSAAAPDGEEWFVMSLLFASARWGDGRGIFSYKSEAEHILHTMLHKHEDPDRGRVTDMFDRQANLVGFVPESAANFFTDPSYQLPHYYELWSRLGGEDAPFWSGAPRASRALLRASADPSTGLFPDYVRCDGRILGGVRKEHDDFRFDAWRVAMNIALDWLWFRCDAWEVTESNRLLRFFASQGITRYGNQYTLRGEELGTDHSAGLVAANAVAALAATDPVRTEFVRELWETPVPRGFYRYYDGMLYMLGILEASGNFRVYAPAAAPR